MHPIQLDHSEQLGEGGIETVGGGTNSHPLVMPCCCQHLGLPGPLRGSYSPASGLSQTERQRGQEGVSDSDSMEGPNTNPSRPLPILLLLLHTHTTPSSSSFPMPRFSHPGSWESPLHGEQPPLYFNLPSALPLTISHTWTLLP